MGRKCSISNLPFKVVKQYIFQDLSYKGWKRDDFNGKYALRILNPHELSALVPGFFFKSKTEFLLIGEVFTFGRRRLLQPIDESIQSVGCWFFRLGVGVVRLLSSFGLT